MATEELSQEQKEKLERYEKNFKLKQGELTSALSVIVDSPVKIQKAILNGQSNCDYFRGVNFHVKAMANKDAIIACLPSYAKDGKKFTLDSIEDSIRLGQEMINFNVIKVITGDPRDKQASPTAPRFVVYDDGAAMNKVGLYTAVDNTTTEMTMFWLGLTIVCIIALMCFKLWPLWLKKVIWYISFYLLIFLVVSAILRVILWGILYHFGLEFWLFPNYFVDSNDPRDSFLPLYSFEVREDMFDIKTNILRVFSGALIVYLCWQFCQEEKNLEDLDDLLRNGVNDLFDYGQEWVVGNALGDGGSAKKDDNSTDTRQETFQEKYRRELKKDLDEFDVDDDENAEEEGVGESTEEDSGDMLDLDDLIKTEEEAAEEEEQIIVEEVVEVESEEKKDL